MIFFTSDTHINHKNIIQYCNRPFTTVEEMTLIITKNWNACVKPTDTIYHLGDVGFFKGDDAIDFINELNGMKYILPGSHDHWIEGLRRRSLRDAGYYIFKSGYQEINIQGQHIVLCHYAMRSWPKSFHGSWHLFGHSHGRLEPYGKSFDVGMDCHNFFPIEFDTIKKQMNLLSNNKD